MEKLKICNIIELCMVVFIGSLLHFVYGWFGGEVWASVGAVNESTWEHLKLLFWPLFIMTIPAYYLYGKDFRIFLPARVVAILTGMAFIVSAFYTYSGILGYNFLAADIATFVVGVVMGYIVNYRLIKRGERTMFHERDMSFISACALAFVLALAAVFVIFTYYPPHIAVFQDPVTGYYGISK